MSTFDDPKPWTDDELDEMADKSDWGFEAALRDPRVGSVNEVAKVLGEIAPLSEKKEFADIASEARRVDAAKEAAEIDPTGMEDDFGQRLAALRFEVNALDSLQVDDLDDAAELLAGLREERDALDKVIGRWSVCLAGGVG